MDEIGEKELRKIEAEWEEEALIFTVKSLRNEIPMDFFETKMSTITASRMQRMELVYNGYNYRKLLKRKQRLSLLKSVLLMVGAVLIAYLLYAIFMNGGIL